MSVSNDRGQTFSSEVKINDDKVPGPHGMHSLAFAKSGRIYVSWLDERNIHKPNRRLRPMVITWKAIATFSSLTRQMAGAHFPPIAKSLLKHVLVVKRHLRFQTTELCTRRLAPGAAREFSSYRCD